MNGTGLLPTAVTPTVPSTPKSACECIDKQELHEFLRFMVYFLCVENPGSKRVFAMSYMVGVWKSTDCTTMVGFSIFQRYKQSSYLSQFCHQRYLSRPLVRQCILWHLCWTHGFIIDIYGLSQRFLGRLLFCVPKEGSFNFLGGSYV